MESKQAKGGHPPWTPRLASTCQYECSPRNTVRAVPPCSPAVPPSTVRVKYRTRTGHKFIISSQQGGTPPLDPPPGQYSYRTIRGQLRQYRTVQYSTVRDRTPAGWHVPYRIGTISKVRSALVGTVRSGSIHLLQYSKHSGTVLVHYRNTLSEGGTPPLAPREGGTPPYWTPLFSSLICLL